MFVRSAVEESLAGAAEEEVLTGFKGYGIPTVLILMKGEFDVFERAANAVCKGVLPLNAFQACAEVLGLSYFSLSQNSL